MWYACERVAQHVSSTPVCQAMQRRGSRRRKEGSGTTDLCALQRLFRCRERLPPRISIMEPEFACKDSSQWNQVTPQNPPWLSMTKNIPGSPTSILLLWHGNLFPSIPVAQSVSSLSSSGTFHNSAQIHSIEINYIRGRTRIEANVNS